MTGMHKNPSRARADRQPLRTWGLLLALLSSLFGPTQAQTSPTPVNLTPQQAKALGIEVQAARPEAQARNPYPARLALLPESVHVVAAPLSATVVAVPLGVGDEVKAGQTVMQLRSAEAVSAVKELQQVRNQLDLAQKSLSRDEQLYAEGLIPLSRLENTRATARQQATLQAAQARSLSLGGVIWQPDGRVNLQAPLASQVVEVSALPGQRVDAGAPLMTLARTNRLQVEVAVPLAALKGLVVGAPLQVSVAAQPDGARSTGRIVAIAPTVSAGAQTVTVRGEIPAASGPWRAGQWVDVSMGPAAEVQRIPAKALMPGVGQGAEVFEATAANRYALRAVKVVGRDGTDVLVQGLRPGAPVVTQGTVALKALQPMKPEAGNPPASHDAR